MSELPALERALADAAQRHYGSLRRARHRGRHVRLAAPIAAFAAIIAVLGLAGLRLPPEKETVVAGPTRAVPAGWTTVTDDDHGLTIQEPPGWRLAAESLTPHLVDPRELFSLGTFDLRYRHGPCNNLPSGALETMGTADAFVTVQERGRGAGAGFPRRPATFQAISGDDDNALTRCLPANAATVRWMPFSDGGRAFYALVVLGPNTTPARRDEAFWILDRLRVDPARTPTWDASP